MALKSANAETKSSSIHDGVNPAFLKIVDTLKLDDTLKELFVEQLKLILEHEKDFPLFTDKMKEIDHWLEQFKQIWEKRFDQLDQVLLNLKSKENGK